jgi:hypothetical protein
VDKPHECVVCLPWSQGLPLIRKQAGRKGAALPKTAMTASPVFANHPGKKER